MLKALTLIVALGLAGCATPTPYQARQGEGAYGFSEQQIENNRLRITFRGNSLTARETVEDYLLFRAAELTAARGFSTFIIANRQTDGERELRSFGTTPSLRSRFDYYFYGPAFGWRGAFDPYWDDVRLREITRFEATAEIVMTQTPPAAGDPQTFNAQDVLTTVGPRIVLPPEG